MAVCDRDQKKAAAFQSQWNVPVAYDDLDQMLEKEALDVVHVLLPPSAHAQTAIQCLRGGCHILVEKPFCLSTQECHEVASVALAQQRQIGVNHNLTYMPKFLKLIDELKQYRLGAVEHVTVVYVLPMPGLAAGQHGHWMFGGTERLILELGPHPVSVIYALLGAVEKAATAVSGEMILTNGQRFFDTWQSSLVCERGSAQLCLSVGKEYANTWIHVVGQDGEAYVDLRRNTIRISEKTKYIRADNLVDAWRNSRRVLADGLRNFSSYAQGAVGLKPPYELQTQSMTASIHAFYNALKSGGKIPVGAVEGTAVVQACEAIIDSAYQFVMGGQNIAANG